MIKLDENTVLYKENEYNNKNNVLHIDFKRFPKLKLRLLSKQKKYNYQAIVVTNETLEIIMIIRAMYIRNDKDRIEFIYDYVCEELDKKWQKYNPCSFCNNKCISSRSNNSEYNSCCYSFKRKAFGKVKKIPCKYLGKDKKCTTSNISCKLFACNYLKKHGFFTKYNDFLILSLFFNKKQKLIIKYNFFQQKEMIIKKLMEKTHKPYLLYLLSLDFDINRD